MSEDPRVIYFVLWAAALTLFAAGFATGLLTP